MYTLPGRIHCRRRIVNVAGSQSDVRRRQIGSDDSLADRAEDGVHRARIWQVVQDHEMLHLDWPERGFDG
jgi:hypothetical protein